MGFGALNYDELLQSFENKKKLSQTDQEAIAKMWRAFQKSDWTALRINAKKISSKIDQMHCSSVRIIQNVSRIYISMNNIIFIYFKFYCFA